VRAQLGGLLAELGDTHTAITQYREAIKLDPDVPAVLNNLAWLLATHPDAALRNGPEAITLAERAVELTGRNQPLLLGTLAAAYAESGRFDDAVKAAQEAVQLAEQRGDEELALKNKELLQRYRQQQPWRESAR
jgi:Flp pilus assembly protein TadD